jgi:PH domain
MFCNPFSLRRSSSTHHNRGLFQDTSDTSSSMTQREGVLLKRRDVFTAQWRPRWFRLQEGMLTYYLLRNQDTSITVIPGIPIELSENLDSETVPRTTIALTGCVVTSEQALSRPEENLYVFSIADSGGGPICYLAATTELGRDEWIESLSMTCSPDEGGIDSVRRKLEFDGHDDPEIEDASDLGGTFADPSEPSILLLASILLSPLVIWKYSDANREMLFVLFAFAAIQALYRLVLGAPFPHIQCSGPVTCQFSVPLKGVLRLLTKRKLEEMSILHVFVQAVGKALSELDAMNSRRVSVLGMESCYPRDQIPLSILYDVDLLGLEDVRSKSMTDIVEMISESKKSPTTMAGIQSSMFPMSPTMDPGSCLIIYNSTDQSTGMQMTVPPVNGFNATIVIGGVSLVRSAGGSSTPRPPTPKLTMAVSMNCSVCHVVTCRKFAERIRELVEAPVDE